MLMTYIRHKYFKIGSVRECFPCIKHMGKMCTCIFAMSMLRMCTFLEFVDKV